MDNKDTKTTHPGLMPIRLLQFNILNRFTEEGLKKIKGFEHALLTGLVVPGIKYHIEEDQLKSPFARCTTKEIHVQEVFLSFMWSFCYSIFVIVEKGIQERVTSIKWKGEILFDNDILIKANQLLNWCLTLNAFYSDWDVELPNPETPNNEEEKFFVEKCNSIFENAACYILFHEYAHLALNHCSFSESTKLKNLSELTESEISKFKQLETEADSFALNSILQGERTETEKLRYGIAVVLAHCAMLFMARTPKNIKKIKHPDTDLRLEKAIKDLQLADQQNADYLWTVGCFACFKFFSIHNIMVTIAPQNPKELFKAYMREFEKVKI